VKLADALRLAAALLDVEEIKDIAADAIADSREQAPRDPADRDSAEVLDDLIEALRAAADDPANNSQQ